MCCSFLVPCRIVLWSSFFKRCRKLSLIRWGWRKWKWLHDGLWSWHWENTLWTNRSFQLLLFGHVFGLVTCFFFITHVGDTGVSLLPDDDANRGCSELDITGEDCESGPFPHRILLSRKRKGPWVVLFVNFSCVLFVFGSLSNRVMIVFFQTM